MKSPYFYIIKHKESGKRYVGSKWAKDADPNNFMTESGYQTSSNTIKTIISLEGLLAFEIEDIITEDELKIPFNDFQTVASYETAFQHYHNCAKSSEWFNSMNNSSNFNFTLLDSTIKKRHKEIMNSPEMWDHIWQVWMEKYGCHPHQTVEVKNKTKNTCLLKYGVDNYAKTEEFKDSIRGDKHPLKKLENKIKCSNSAKRPETISKRNLTNSLKPDIVCPICGASGRSKSMRRYHFDKCGIKETRKKRLHVSDLIENMMENI